MPVLKWKKDEFKIASQILNTATFDEWIKKEGRTVLEDEMRRSPARWFFGKTRAHNKLLNEARRALKPGSPFNEALKRRLDQLPTVIRKIGVSIKRRGQKHLFSADATKALVVVPRALVQNEFTTYLTDELGRSGQLVRLRGLANRVLKECAIEAEQLFCQFLEKGKQHLDNGKGLILGVDANFGWKLNRVNGHYYYAYSGKDGDDLSNRKELRRFKSEMEEILFGQEEYLKRLRPDEVAEIVGSFRGR